MKEMKWSRGCCDSPIMKPGDDEMVGGPCVVSVGKAAVGKEGEMITVVKSVMVEDRQ